MYILVSYGLKKKSLSFLTKILFEIDLKQIEQKAAKMNYNENSNWLSDFRFIDTRNYDFGEWCSLTLCGQKCIGSPVWESSIGFSLALLRDDSLKQV